MINKTGDKEKDELIIKGEIIKLFKSSLVFANSFLDEMYYLSAQILVHNLIYHRMVSSKCII